MKVRYYDPIFYTSSAEMPFTIRVEMVMKERVREDALSRAVARAAKRYPYFLLRIVRSIPGRRSCRWGAKLSQGTCLRFRIMKTRSVFMPPMPSRTEAVLPHS